MASYQSTTHFWEDKHFLDSTILQRLLVVYVMHGPTRTNVPGLCGDSVVTLADRLVLDPSEVRAALADCRHPDVLQYDEQRRLLRSVIAARADTHKGSRNLAGWYKNWQHLPLSDLKYDHIATLREKVDVQNADQVAVWNNTFGLERAGKYRMGAEAPRQPALPGVVDTKNGRPYTRRQRKRVENAALPGRDSVEFIGLEDYEGRHVLDLLRGGQIAELGGDADTLAAALLAMHEKVASESKRISGWDETALNFVDTQLFIEDKKKKREGAHEADRTSGSGSGRAAKPAKRRAKEAPGGGKWGARVREQAAPAVAAPDT